MRQYLEELCDYCDKPCKHSGRRCPMKKAFFDGWEACENEREKPWYLSLLEVMFRYAIAFAVALFILR